MTLGLFDLGVGTFGACLLGFLQDGKWTSLRVYGAIVLIPIALIAFHFLIKLPYKVCLDMMVVQSCIFFAVMKCNCWYLGCCSGIEMQISSELVRFPIQPIDALMYLILAVGFFILQYKQKLINIQLQLFLIFHGILRFGLSFLRDDPTYFIGHMNANIFFSITTFIIGFVWLFINYLLQTKKGDFNA